MASHQSSVVYRTETIFNVEPAVSAKNIYAGITIPQNPGMGENNYSSGHQDSYCSESVGLTGPTSKKLKLITQYNPYGFTSIMACNANNQMVAISFIGEFFLVVFDSDCHIISSTKFGRYSGSFAGGYFYLNNDYDAIVTTGSRLECYPTACVPQKSEVYSLEAKWKSADIIREVTGNIKGNTLYSALPIWGQTNLYWCLLAGDYDTSSGELQSPAYMAAVEIVPDAKKVDGCTTKVKGYLKLENQWNNNTFSVDDTGAAYFVTNVMKSKTVPADFGNLFCVIYDSAKSTVVAKWIYPYKSCGLLKTGQKNIGSGTTPTVMVGDDGTKSVAITDNANPRMNVVVVDCESGKLIAEKPVFSKMRSADEASLIGVNNRVVVENNFGHTIDYPYSQLVSNEPGMDLIEVLPSTKSAETIWNNERTTFFGMSMLARKSGIIFAYSGAWYETISTTEGPEYSVIAIDAYDGRIIWRIPVGRGFKYCHEYGGLYFNRTGSGTSMFVGTNRYLVSIQNVDTKIIV